MKPTMTCAMALSIVAAVALAQGRTETPESLLGAAIHQEEAEGNLDAAIAAYKQFLAHYGSNKPLAARAQLHVGLCLEKLGSVEARQQFEVVLRDYPDQRDVAAAARTHLTASAQGVAGGRAGMVSRQIWTGAGVDLSSDISPDGQSVVFRDRQTGDLAVRDLNSGTSRNLGVHSSAAAQSGDYPYGYRFSRNGRQIAYGWNVGKPDGQEQVWELRLVNADGTNRRTIAHLELASDGYAYPMDWSPDGKLIATVEFKNWKETFLLLISVEDGRVRQLTPVKFPLPNKASFSPDGRYIVYDGPSQADANQTDTYIVQVDGLSPPALAQRQAIAPLWSVDGKRLLFLSDRTGTMDLWSAGIPDGTPGEARLVKAALGQHVYPIGISSRGAYHYGVSAATYDVHVADLAPSTWQMTGSPVRVSEKNFGDNSVPCWSPDGQWLAYRSERYRGFGSSAGPLRITLRSSSTGEERDLFAGDNVRGFWQGPMNWYPDGSALLVASWPNGGGGRTTFYRVDVKTGQTTLVANNTANFARIAADGKKIYFMNLHKILVHDNETQQETEIYRVPGIGLTGLALSRDGKNLAFLERVQGPQAGVRLMILPVGGGPAHEVARSTSFVWVGAVEWTPDDRFIFVGRKLVSVDSGKEEVAITPFGVTHVSIHPDGKRLAFATYKASAADIWVLENFQP